MNDEVVARPGRPRQFDTERLVEAAMDVFWRKGYAETSTRDLERALGVRQSSLYNAFGSKTGLLAAAVGRYRTAIQVDLLAPLAGSEDPTAGLVDFVAGVSRRAAQDGRGCLMVNLMTAADEHEPVIAEQLAAHRATLRRALRNALERQDPTAGREALDRRSSLLAAVVVGINVAGRAGMSRAERQRLLAAAQDQIRGWSP